MDIEPRKRRKLVIASIFGIGLLGALVWYASPGKILATLKAADYRLILAAWGVTLLTTAVRTARFSMFVPLKGRVLRAYAVFSTARFVNLAFPFRTGDLAMLAILKRSGLASTISQLLPVWLVLRVSDALALAVWVCGAVALSTFGREYLPVALTIVVLSIVALFFMQYAVSLVPERWLQEQKNWFAGRMIAVVDGVRASEGVVKRIVASLAGMLIWGLLIGSAVLVQFAFGTPLDPRTAIVAAVFASAFSVIPINAPLAVGTGEVMWTAALMLVGLPLETAVPLAIGVRVSSLAILIIEGAAGGALLTWFSGPGAATVGSVKTV